MNDAKATMDRLTDETRIRGATWMFADNKKPEAVTDEEAQGVIDNLLTYINQTGITRTAIAKSLGIAGSTLGSVLNGNYIGASREILIDVDRWLEEQLKRDSAPQSSTFVWTRVADQIRTIAKTASLMRSIGCVYGPTTSGFGKTMALQTLAATMPGAVLITVEEPGNSVGGLLKSLCRALRRADTGPQERMFESIKQALSGSTRLLMIDEIHLLFGVRNDAPLFMLKSLIDSTQSPQLWCGTADVMAYLDQQQAKGKPTLAQIRRRIGINRDLLDRSGSAGDGDPVFSVDELKAIYSKNPMRLAPDAARYLCELANLPDCGALGLCTNLVRVATHINEGSATVLTAAMLRATHKTLIVSRAYTLLENRLSLINPAPMMKVG